MLTQISGPIYLVKGKNKGRFPYSHSILIRTEQTGDVLIDTGCGIEILKELKGRTDIHTVINSHTHPDHSAGNAVFSENGPTLFVPVESIDTAGSIVALSNRLAEPGDLALYWQNFVSETLGFIDYTPTGTYDETTLFHFDDVTLKPIHTPGHTADHYCLYEPDRKILFSFDYDLTGFGPWYGHRESNISEFISSIDRLLDLEIECLVSGHKGIITDRIKESLSAYARVFDERDELIFSHIQNGASTTDELVDRSPIYGGFPYAEPLLRYWEGRMIDLHLERLIDGGRVVRREGDILDVVK
ncbi:MAG: MBL fold metallo-hydrolase [Deltaproteobacteria bacterium]|nr:MBL fold metallo-hydrolase [Candidatus Zymogenaceae bacterium]